MDEITQKEIEPQMFEKDTMGKGSDLTVSSNNTNTSNIMVKILETLNNYFYNDTKISPRDLQLIYPFLVLTSFSYTELQNLYKLVHEPKLLSENEYIYGKNSFDLSYVFDGLGYNTKPSFIYCLAYQQAYGKEFGGLELFKNIDWFVNYCKENEINNPEEEFARFDIINLFNLRMALEKRETTFPFAILQRALLILYTTENE